MLIPLSILVPHYEVNFFRERRFIVDFDRKRSIEFTGAELMALSARGEIRKNLVAIAQRKDEMAYPPKSV